MFPRVLGIVIVSALAACAPMRSAVDLNDPEAVMLDIRVDLDEFRKVVTYEGANVATNLFARVYLRAWKHQQSGDVSFQIYVMDYYEGRWRFYDAAHGADGVRLGTTQISRDVGACGDYGCSHWEHLGLDVSRAYLEKHQTSGLRFQISGKGGSQVFFLPGGYIRGFLAKAQ